MTAVASAAVLAPDAAGTPGHAPADPPPTRPTPGRPAARPPLPAWAALTAWALGLLGALVVGFLAYLLGLSALQETRSQDVLYRTFRSQLANAVAPVGPTSPGAPVAVLTIPAIRLRQVVVEGTTAGLLTRGPGHRRDSVLPGQAGVALIYGRRAGFGGPFRRLPSLRAGTVVTVVTGQATSRYVVTAVRDGRSPNPPFTAGSPLLRLVTSAPAGAPGHTVVVTARLVTPVQRDNGSVAPMGSAERALAGDSSAILPLALWGLLLVPAVAATTVLYLRWARWSTYLVTTPVLLALLWNVYENAAQLLPNLL